MKTENLLSTVEIVRRMDQAIRLAIANADTTGQHNTVALNVGIVLGCAESILASRAALEREILHLGLEADLKGRGK